MSSSFTLRPILVALSAAGLALGLALRLFGQEEWAAWVWGAFTVPVLLALLIEIVLKLRSGEVGLDIVAALSMTAALVFGEELAAVVVALMYPKVPTPASCAWSKRHSARRPRCLD